MVVPGGPPYGHCRPQKFFLREGSSLMPVSPTYPGVYVEEIPSGVQTITGVASSVAAFVDFFPRGPMNRPVQIFNMSDFEREFGGLNKLSESSYSIQQFFLNGGSEAWVVRTASGSPAQAAVKIKVSAAGGTALTVTAISEGDWGNNLRVRIDRNAPVTGEFNLMVTEVRKVNNRLTVVREEVFRNLSMVGTNPNYVGAVVNDALTGSKLIRVTPDGNDPPLPNGTLSGEHQAAPAIQSFTSSVDQPNSKSKVTLRVKMKMADAAEETVTFSVVVDKPAAGAKPKVPLAIAAPALQAAIRALKPADPLYAETMVDVVSQNGKQRLRVLTGAKVLKTVSFALVAAAAADPGDSTATDLKLTSAEGAVANVQYYLLGRGGGEIPDVTKEVADTAHGVGTAGDDGKAPGAPDLVNGINALEDVDLFNLLCVPRAALVGGAVEKQLDSLSATEASVVMSVAVAMCERRRAIFLVDTPYGVNEYTAIREWLGSHDSLRSRNAALYYPRVQVPDPLNNFRLRSVGASGTVAGLMARTDTASGIWKAPAGTDAVLRNVPKLDDVLTDPENGALNPLAINCIRTFPVYGTVVWGARTLDGSDQAGSEWKYLPVRRLALYIEESLFRGTKWVVFRPNDEPLWAQIRLNIGAFMHNLFRQGAFQGRTPREAYLVKCDKETTTQTHINQGVVNIVVGFAPLKPAEFVILKLQQMAGQISE